MGPATPPSRRAGPSLALALGLLLLLGGCGEPEPSVDELFARLDDAFEAEEVEEVVAAIGERGAREPDVVVPRLVERLREERRDPGFLRIRIALALEGVGPGADREALMARTREIVMGRLQRHGHGIASLEEVGPGDLIVRVAAEGHPEGPEAYAERLVGDLARSGRAQLGVVVPPPDAPAGGPAPWPGDRESYEALLGAAGAARPPAAPAGIVAAPPLAGAGAGEALLLRVETPTGRRVGGGDLELALEGGDDAASIVVGIDAAAREVLDVLTGGDGTARVALLLGSRHAGAVEASALADGALRFPLDDPDAVAAARRRLADLRAGAWPRPVHVRPDPAEPQRPDTPTARALVAVGPAADPYLAELTRAPGHVGAAARWARERILRGRAVGRDADY